MVFKPNLCFWITPRLQIVASVFYLYLYSLSILITYMFLFFSRLFCLPWFLPEITVFRLVLYQVATKTLTLHNRGGCEASSWWCRLQQRWRPAGRDQRRLIQLWQLCLAEEEILDTEQSSIENSDDRVYERIADRMAKPNTGSCFFVVRSCDIIIYWSIITFHKNRWSLMANV